VSGATCNTSGESRWYDRAKDPPEAESQGLQPGWASKTVEQQVARAAGLKLGGLEAAGC